MHSMLPIRILWSFWLSETKFQTCGETHFLQWWVPEHSSILLTLLALCPPELNVESRGSFILKFYFIFFCILLLLLLFLLYNVVLVLPYINMHPPRVYTCSPSWTPLSPPSPYHPSGSSQCTSPKLPVSCIKPGLAIRFLHDIIHVLMPFSQIIPPPSPTESKRLFYTSVSLLLSCIQALKNWK